MSDKFRKDMTQSQKNALTSQIGAQATVQRESYKHDRASECNDRLNAIGRDLIPQGAKYLGSAAVHIYQYEALDTLANINQVYTLLDTPEVLGAKAFDDLKGRVMEYYGRRAPKLRSKF